MRQAAIPVLALRQRYFAADIPEDDEASSSSGAGRHLGEHTLPYRVELWDQTKSFVEQVLAVTAHGSIGYAAYYAATREYPHRYVTLRHKGGIVSRWNGPGH
jgi:hypothetical protein